MPGRLPVRQRGVALISVLLVFALATLLATEMLSRGYLDLRRTGNQLAARQAHYYTLGAEAWARQVLARDHRDDKTSPGDDLSELWATELMPFEIDEGELAVRIEDLSGRFNLNNLVTNEGKVNGAQRAAFEQLLRALDLPPTLAAVLIDWLDPDNQPTPGGAEDPYYSATDSAYLAANRQLADASELRLLAGLDAEAYAKLEPYVAALPTTGAEVNINTAKDKVLEAIYPTLSRSDIDRIQSDQQRGGYASVSDFHARYGTTASVATATASEYFQVSVAAVYAGRVSRLRTVLQRETGSGELVVISRQQGLKFEDALGGSS